MRMEEMAIEGGFHDAVMQAQTNFRGLMDAMAQPGTIFRDLALPRPPAPLSPEAGAVALTLCDADTPIWLDPALSAEKAVTTWLGFHTGAPVVDQPSAAHFALVSQPSELIALENFAQGSQSYPDRSATIILQVENLSHGGALRLSGPGIRDEAELAPTSMPRHFLQQWAQNNERSPRGVDLVLVSRAGSACLPRTTRITMKEG